MHFVFSRKEPIIYKPKLINAKLLYSKYPNSFHLPSKVDIDNLIIGDYVIVYDNDTLEHLWIRLGITQSKNMVGKIYSILSENSKHECENLIYLKRNNICRISKQKYINLY